MKLAWLLTLWLVAPVVAAPRAPVAVFNETGFPYFPDGWCGLTPPDVASHLRELGLPAELLDAQQLADPRVLNAQRFCALVHVYGNPFALEAADNLRRFHRQGGGLISTGVPYCHPCRQVGAEGWTYVAATSDRIECAADNAHGGRACLRLRKDSTPHWTGAYSTRAPARSGTAYRVSGWARTEGAPGSPESDVLYVRFFGEGDRFLGQWGPRLPAAAREWQLLTYEVQAPEGAQAMDVCVGFWGSPGTVWLDDVCLSRADQPEANLVANGGFEKPGGGWGDLGHDQAFMRHDRIGSGEFHLATAERGPLEYHREDDPLSLGLIGWSRWATMWDGHIVSTAALDPHSLPAEDEVLSIVDYRDGNQTWPVVALIRHRCREFRGAVDAWAGGHLFGVIGAYDPVAEREVVARAAIAVAAETGGLSETERRRLLASADRVYTRDRPPRDLRPASDLEPPDGIFPKCPAPARELVVADVRQVKPDEHRLLASLQGLVNRAQPRIYLVAGVYIDEPNLDERWLSWLQARGDIDGVRRVSEPLSLLREFRDAYRGVVVTDPAVPATVNVATMVAATEDLLIASPELERRLDLPVRRDLRGRWKTNAEALAWAVDKLWPKLNHRLLAFNAPDFPYLTDYLVAQKAFAFWVSGAVDGTPPVGAPLAEQLVIERLLAKAPPNIGCVGAPYHSQGVGLEEGPGVALLTRYGNFLAWSSHNCNLSVHSGTTPRGAFRQRPAPCPPLEHDKVYLSLMVSDGDSPTIWYGFFLKRYWDDPAHGTFPVTWSMGPSVYDLMPDIMDYYYTRATERDCFIAAPSGAGYCFPDFFASQYADPEAIYSRHLKLTDEYMRRLDLHGLWTHIATGARLKAFAEQVPSVSFLMPDYGRLPGTTAENANCLAAGRIPMFHALTSCDMNQSEDQAMRMMLDDFRRYTPAERPGFMHVFVQCYPWSATRLRAMLEQLGPQYVVVRADHLAALYLQAQEQ